jgi:hypothetical protein
VLSVSVNQSYYTNEAASQFDNAYSYSALFRPPSNFSTIAVSARTMPTEAVGVDVRAEYDPIALERPLVGLGINGVIRSRLIESTAGWSRQSFGGGTQVSSNHYIQQSTTLRLAGNKVGGTVQFNYDIGRSTLLNQRYIINYNAQCCGLAFEYQAFNYGGAGLVVPQDRRINFAFTLAGIGSFSNFFGTFGGQSY